MNAYFQRQAYPDEWIKIRETSVSSRLRAPLVLIRFLLMPIPGTSYTFQSYCLGFRCDATERELEIIRNQNLFGQTFLSIHEDGPPVTFATILGPGWIAEVNHNHELLLEVEGKVRSAAAMWTHFFESMPGPG